MNRLDIMSLKGVHPGRSRSLAIVLISAVASPLAFAGAQTINNQPAARQQAGSRAAKGLAFEVTYSATFHAEPVTSRVYVFVEPESSGAEPRLGPDWFRPQPFFAVNVASWKPGEVLRIDSKSDGFPGRLDELEPGRYAIQAVVRLNHDTHKLGDGDGNAYGPVVHAQLDPKEGATIALTIDHTVKPRKFSTTDRIKFVELPSAKLSAFYHRPIKHRAAVILPREMIEGHSTTKVPTLYIIPGFGGDHTMASRIADSSRFAFGKDFLRVLLDPDCGTGHHVFADSATNGPRGTALVEEFIPYIERTFPVIADARARLVNGHSSGGWTSLWLQVSYPDTFGGTWSTSPDPVDFRDFQRINLYAAGENMFRDRAGKRRPIARMGAMPMLYYDRFCRMDDVIGWGGQLGSFEAVFSPLDKGGQPRKLWDRSSGAIDPAVAKAWEAYDIRLVLERNWPVLGPKLKGKLHVITGEMDTFYLEGAVKLLKESLAKLGSDATIEIVPDRDHSTLVDPELAQRIDGEMNAAVRSVRSAEPASQD
jgi:pimeloyl-ACP methyl ester carboxylesterase